MSAESLSPSVCREDALNALTEIRACRGELQAFLAATFDRLDSLIDRLQTERPGQEQSGPQTEAGTLQNQIDQLARLATDLAQSVAKRERRGAGQNRTGL